MPPTIRRRSRITEPSEDVVLDSGIVSRRNSRSRSRGKSEARNDSAQLEVEWEQRQSRLAVETTRSRKGSVATELEAEILKKRQSKVVLDVRTQDVDMGDRGERGMEEEVLERRQSTVIASSTTSTKERTLSMEMHDAIDAVGQEDGDGEGRLHD
jgi:hypothetical protein